MNRNFLSNLTLSFGLGCVALAGINYKAAAQAADPVVSNSRTTLNYLGAANIYATLASTGTVSLDVENAKTPSGLAGGAAFASNASGNAAKIAFSNNTTTLAIRGDILVETDNNSNLATRDGDGATGVTRFFRYYHSLQPAVPDAAKGSTTISILDGVKGDPNFTNNTGGRAYPDTYIGVGAGAPSGRRYLFNANNLIINKTSGQNGAPGIPVLDNLIFFNRISVEVAGALTLTSGRLLLGATDSVIIMPANLVAGTTGGTVSGGSINSYVDGIMINRNLASLNQLFPLGDHSIYAPVTIMNPVAFTTPNTLRYFADSTTPNTGSKAGNIDVISPYEYYTITSTAPATTTTITLPYNPATRPNYFTNTSNLTLVGYNGTIWNQIGNSSVDVNNNLVTTLTQPLTGITHIAVASLAAPLPVKFISFDASKDESKNRSILQWAMGDNARGITSFSVERSADGRSFGNIATVKVTGIEGGKFTAYDEEPLPGINYFRIKAIAQDGSTLQSAVRKLTYDLAGGSITLAPNPATDATYVSFTGKAEYGFATFRITDATGRVVLWQQALANAGNRVELNISRLVPGTYTLQVSGNRNTDLFTTRFTKQ